MKRLLVAMMLLAGPVQAQPANKAWGECVAAELRARELLTGSVGWISVNIAAACKSRYRGDPDTDVDVIVKIVEGFRAQDAGNVPFTIGPSSPLPPGDKKM